jgi:hypothetical protein
MNLYAEQNPANNTLLEFREEPYRQACCMTELRVDATDDGGIWVVRKSKDKSPWMWNRRLTLLEAKRVFQRIDDDNRLGQSDDHLTQYTCETLTACLENSEEDEYV